MRVFIENVGERFRPYNIADGYDENLRINSSNEELATALSLMASEGISKDITTGNINSKIKWSDDMEIRTKQENFLSNMLNVYRDNKSSDGTSTFSFTTNKACERYIKLLFGI